MRRAVAALLAAVLAGCGGLALPEEIGTDFDLDGFLGELRDCDRLSETFVAVVREAAEDLDTVAERVGGLVPSQDIAAKVDLVSGTAYFEVAEKLGCAAVSHRLDTLDRLRGLNPESPAGESLVEEVIRELENRSG